MRECSEKKYFGVKETERERGVRERERKKKKESIYRPVKEVELYFPYLLFVFASIFFTLTLSACFVLFLYIFYSDMSHDEGPFIDPKL